MFWSLSLDTDLVAVSVPKDVIARWYICAAKVCGTRYNRAANSMECHFSANHEPCCHTG